LLKYLSGLRHFAGDIFHHAQDQITFWNVKRQGGTYTDFYEIKMDRKALKDGIEVSGRPRDKVFHLDYLRKQGLVPSMHFLDFGCGAAASGVSIIEFLDKGRYTGADISQECLRHANSLIASNQLSDKAPVFLHLPGGSTAPLRNKQYDVIWAQSVLTHLPPAEIQTFFDLVKKHLAPGGRAFATYTHNNSSIEQKRTKNYEYNEGILQTMASNAGLRAKRLDCWIHPRSSLDYMLEIKDQH